MSSFFIYFILSCMFIVSNVSPKQLEYNLRKAEQNQGMNQQITSIRLEQSNISVYVTSKSKIYDKVVYLTFDDGPSHNTQRILDILKQYNIKATFFVNYKENCDELYKRIYSEGHAIGNHTYSHEYNIIYQSPAAFFEDYDKLNKYLYSLLGITPDIMRFPGGSNNTLGSSDIMSQISKELIRRGIQYTDWNSMNGDAETTQLVAKEQLASMVETTAIGENKVIVLMHDTNAKDTTPDALPEIIQYFKTQNYVFAPLTKDEYTVHFLQ